jgi:membrane protease YdiL (CAAX protease family)
MVRSGSFNISVFTRSDHLLVCSIFRKLFSGLQLKFDPFSAAVILGLLHAAWHLLPDYLGGISFYKNFYPLHFLLWVVALTAFRLIAVWIYNHTNSLLLAQLAHASFTGTQFIFGPPAATASESVLWYGVFTAALCMVTLLIITKDKKLFFSKKNQLIQDKIYIKT